MTRLGEIWKLTAVPKLRNVEFDSYCITRTERQRCIRVMKFLNAQLIQPFSIRRRQPGCVIRTIMFTDIKRVVLGKEASID